MSDRKVILTPDAPSAQYSKIFSQAILCGDFLFISGTLPFDMATGKLSTGDIAEQTRSALRNMAAVAEKAGTSLENAVKATVFFTDMADFDEINKAYAEFFPNGAPARSSFAVAGLPLNGKIEIEAICTL